MSCFKNKRIITAQVQSYGKGKGGGRGGGCCRSQKSLKLNLVMDLTLFSLTHD